MWSGEPIDFVCNGVRVRSPIPLGFPIADRPASAVDVIVEPGRIEVEALPDGLDADFQVEAGALTLVVRGVGRFRAVDGRRIVIDSDPGTPEEDIRLYLSGSVLGAIWLQRGLLPLHASAVELPDGGCVAFVGQSGAGKSSLAAHFARAGHPLVTDDVSVLAERDGGFAVWPGTSRVKLAADALASLEQDSSSLSPTGGTREKYHLEVDNVTAAAAPVALRAVFLLSYGEGSPRTVPLNGLDAIDAVGGHTYRQEFVGPLGIEADWLRRVAAVARIVPVSRLIRPHGYNRTDSTIQAVLAATGGDPNTEVK